MKSLAAFTAEASRLAHVIGAYSDARYAALPVPTKGRSKGGGVDPYRELQAVHRDVSAKIKEAAAPLDRAQGQLDQLKHAALAIVGKQELDGLPADLRFACTIAKAGSDAALCNATTLSKRMLRDVADGQAVLDQARKYMKSLVAVTIIAKHSGASRYLESCGLPPILSEAAQARLRNAKRSLARRSAKAREALDAR